jgi:hypothetical protein
MRLIKPSYEILWHMDRPATLALLERAARICYKSEEKIGPGTAEKLVKFLLSRDPPHESVIEHVSGLWPTTSCYESNVVFVQYASRLKRLYVAARSERSPSITVMRRAAFVGCSATHAIRR